jgi:hypothetical protein
MRSHTKRIARTRSSSETVAMSSTYCRTSGNVSVPSEGVRAPSAIVGGLLTVCSTPVRNERVASSASSGSTPTTRQPGASARAASAEPESSPPPPQQTSSRSSTPTSPKSSRAAVPWPAITSAWS